MFYEFTAKDNQGREVCLDSYKGKVVLVVNTATGCGLTPQYEALQKLYDAYKDRGFIVLDFPCNQFLEQAPGSDEEIDSFCKTHYRTSFPRFAKIEVNGPGAHPLYRYLKEQKPEDVQNEETPGFYQKLRDLKQVFPGSEIKWNFTKFLIDRKGTVAARFAPNCKPEELKVEIEKLL